MITLEMIRAGLDAGVVKLIDSPNDKEPACQIGELWFYYASDVASGLTTKQYLAGTGMDEVIRRILVALNGLKNDLGAKAEYLYYEALLSKFSTETPKPPTFTGVIKETLRREVPIVANNMEEARRKLEELYYNGDVVLIADDFVKSTLKIYRSDERAV